MSNTSNASVGPSPPRPASGPRETIVIRPPGLLSALDPRDLVRYRGVLWRKVKQRVLLDYDRMWLGFIWAVARPLLMVLVFWTIRGLSDARTGVTISYPLYVYTGLVGWFFFADAVTDVASSLQRDAGLITKVWFPRLISPLSHLLARGHDLAMAALPLAVLMAVFGEWPDARVLLLPLVVLQVMLLALGIGLIFSTLVLASRDWERFLRLALYVGLWVSPVIYSLDMIPPEYARAYLVNPMGGSLLALRATLFAGFEFDWSAWGASSAVTLVTLVIGLIAFQRAERSLADRI